MYRFLEKHNQQKKTENLNTFIVILIALITKSLNKENQDQMALLAILINHLKMNYTIPSQILPKH